MKIICKQYYTVIFAAVIFIMAIGLISTSALAWHGGGHYWATEAAVQQLFGAETEVQKGGVRSIFLA